MLEQLLTQNHDAIVKKWFKCVLETYPVDSRSFFGEQKDRFSNPVGNAISRAVEALFIEMLSGTNEEKTYDALDEVVRIRAVQDFTPSEAVGFISELKKIIRSELKDRSDENVGEDEFCEFDSRIDKVAALAEKKYAECKQKINEIRANEIHKRTAWIQERLKKKQNIGSDKEGS